MAIAPVAVLEDVLLDVVEADNPSRTYDVTDKAVEGGANISDHMHERPTTLTISGVIVGADASTRLSRIIRYQTNRQLVSYTNRVIHTNMAITNIDTNHGRKIANGLSFRIRMKHVRRAAPMFAEITGVPPSVATKAAHTQHAGTQQLAQTDKQANNKEADARLAYKSRNWAEASISE
ncbi:MAG: hypothetical protein FWD98_02550 [Defluviitaleaceae bacterium]|nr:hypothetical protein [Defluviitaleaceae bacterium]